MALKFVGIGKSTRGTVDNTGSYEIVKNGQFKEWVTIQNVDKANDLIISFMNPVLPDSDFVLTPGAALTIPYGLIASLYGMSSGSSTKYACIGG